MDNQAPPITVIKIKLPLCLRLQLGTKRRFTTDQRNKLWKTKMKIGVGGVAEVGEAEVGEATVGEAIVEEAAVGGGPAAVDGGRAKTGNEVPVVGAEAVAPGA